MVAAARAAGLSPFRQFIKTWYEPDVTVGVACGGAGWYLTHLIRHQDVVWNRHTNPEPWNRVQQGTNCKLMSVNADFERKYSRDKW
ncbi:hypothetical protein MNV49_003932 [Pseudohyphozyma bogoriensis]|nr:hypothetical protein MNV49_003932 [Pseudohyphozyma bogoriensis]